MPENVGFCTSCGAPLVAGNAFCTRCGSALPAAAPQPATAPPAAPVAPAPVAPQAPAPAQPPSADEQVLSILGGLTISSGFMGIKKTSYTLVMTNRRLVFAQLTSAMLKAAIESARAETKADGGGFFKQWGAQLSAAFQYAEQYWQMTPEMALAETPGNFALDREAITKMKLHAGITRAEGPDDPDYVTIKTATGKYKLEIGTGSFAHAKEALIRAGLI